MPLSKQEKKEKFSLVIVAMALPKMKKKNLNGIMAMSLPKMGEKKNFVAKIWEEIFKKVLCSQYFYNTFTTNHGDQLLLVQI